ncbi:HemY protein [Thiohalospira halophila DSM 15071]|uniref:HemY protein n=1 Tax=Thiohalospira halophila DSM 15071 TaxID=1123397 RepID=A0A1I1VDV2_9GAMM|nr:heme biosynthesis HemY N-terminal domain-containing protein [Thiohalospira halophila]SFD81104.1 HemY protein [Thiohalospira halophila DSM 15071]
MRRLLLLLLVIAGATAVAIWAHRDPGYLLLARGPWSVEMSLTVAVVAALFAFIVGYSLVRLAANLLDAPGTLRHWRRRRRTLRGMGLLRRGEIEFAEGRWPAAERHLERAARRGSHSLPAYIGAARAAQRQHAHERRDDYLNRAHRSEPDADLAVLLTRAELQLAHRQYEESLASLLHLRSIAPRHRYVLALLARLYRAQGAWTELADLLPELRKRQALGNEELVELERTTWAHRLERAEAGGRREELLDVWDAIPRQRRSEAALVGRYAAALHRLGGGGDAEVVLRRWLKHHWDPAVVRLYGLVHGADPAHQLSVAEKWLRGHEGEADLLLTLGRLSFRRELWGKARHYLETSLDTESRVETHRELAVLLERLGENEAAIKHWRRGVEAALATGSDDLAAQSPAGSKASA